MAIARRELSRSQRLQSLVRVLRKLGVQEGDTFTSEEWTRVELAAFGPISNDHKRAYRQALVGLGVIQQLGGGRGGVPIQGMKIRSLPEELPLAA